MWFQANPLNPCSNLVFVLVSAQHGQGDDSGEEVHRQGLEAPHSTGEPAQRWAFHFRRVGQDGFLLRCQEGPDFPQRLQQLVKRGITAVPLSCWGRSASVLTQGEFCDCFHNMSGNPWALPLNQIGLVQKWSNLSDHWRWSCVDK